MSLRNKVVLITGATGNLGSAVARAMAAADVKLALTSRTLEDLESLAEKLDLAGDHIFLTAADVTQPEEARALVKSVVAHFGRLDILINTVGSWSGGAAVHELTPTAWNRSLALNLTSAFLLSHEVLPHMLENAWGRIIHISSKGAVSPRPKESSYDVAKMGLITLTEVIAAEVKGKGITANVVLPSILDTPPNRQMIPDADTDTWVQPDEIASTIRHLCTEDAAAINGARIAIYGAV